MISLSGILIFLLFSIQSTYGQSSTTGKLYLSYGYIAEGKIISITDDYIVFQEFGTSLSSKVPIINIYKLESNQGELLIHNPHLKEYFERSKQGRQGLSETVVKVTPAKLDSRLDLIILVDGTNVKGYLIQTIDDELQIVTVENEFKSVKIRDLNRIVNYRGINVFDRNPLNSNTPNISLPEAYSKSKTDFYRIKVSLNLEKRWISGWSNWSFFNPRVDLNFSRNKSIGFSYGNKEFESSQNFFFGNNLKRERSFYQVHFTKGIGNLSPVVKFYFDFGAGNYKRIEYGNVKEGLLISLGYKFDLITQKRINYHLKFGPEIMWGDNVAFLLSFGVSGTLRKLGGNE